MLNFDINPGFLIFTSTLRVKSMYAHSSSFSRDTVIRKIVQGPLPSERGLNTNTCILRSPSRTQGHLCRMCKVRAACTSHASSSMICNEQHARHASQRWVQPAPFSTAREAVGSFTGIWCVQAFTVLFRIMYIVVFHALHMYHPLSPGLRPCIL